MLHLPEIWDCLKNYLPRDRWISLSEIYYLIENSLSLDSEDLEPQSPTSNLPKWKRNVRNVLQYRKKTKEIEWDGHGRYKMKGHKDRLLVKKSVANKHKKATGISKCKIPFEQNPKQSFDELITIKMQEKPHPNLLDRETPKSEIEEHFSDSIYLLKDLTNYGTNLIPRCMESSQKTLTDMIVLGTLLKQAVSMNDAIEILFSNAAVNAAFLQLRVLFEVSLYIEWILKKDTELKALHYYIWNKKQDKLWHLRIIEGTPERNKFADDLKEFNFFEKYKEPRIQKKAKEEIAKIDRLLNSEKFVEINRSFETGKRVKWYQPLGVNTIKDIAKELDRLPEYTIIYSEISNIIHTSSYKSHMNFKRKKVEFKHIRSLEKLNTLLEFTISLCYMIYRNILSYYRPEELTNFSRKYIEDWRSKFFSIKKVSYGQ